MCQTFRFAVKCSPSSHRRLTDIFGLSAELYNAVLESWKGTYRWWREHHPDPDERFPSELNQSHVDRLKMFTGVRRDRSEWARLDTRVGRGVLCRFERTVQSFYKRCEKGKKVGFPRFKSSRRWRTVEIPDVSSGMIQPPGTSKNQSAKWWRLSVKGIPRLRFRDKHGRLAAVLASGGTVRELRVVRTALRTEVHAVVRLPKQTLPDKPPVNPVGVDVGLRRRVTLSDGTSIPARAPDLSTVKRAQRRVSRAVIGSHNRAKKVRALARIRRRERERAVQADFRLAHYLVGAYDGIALENLNISGMLRTKRFSKKLSDQRWAALARIVEYKAAKAGIPCQRVNPAHTSTDCAACGHRQPMPLEARAFHCEACGWCADRDVNAAINIRARAFGPGSGGTTPDAMRTTNFCCKTPAPPGKAMQTDIAKQYPRATPWHQVYKSLTMNAVHFPLQSGEQTSGSGSSGRGSDPTAVFRPVDPHSPLRREELGRLEGFGGWGLMVEKGAQAGRTYPLSEGVNEVGRHLHSRILLDDITVSRRHCRLTAEADRLTVEDEGSTNGTYVNGARMEESRLLPGDRLMVGRFHLVVVRGND